MPGSVSTSERISTMRRWCSTIRGGWCSSTVWPSFWRASLGWWTPCWPWAPTTRLMPLTSPYPMCPSKWWFGVERQPSCQLSTSLDSLIGTSQWQEPTSCIIGQWCAWSSVEASTWTCPSLAWISSPTIRWAGSYTSVQTGSPSRLRSRMPHTSTLWCFMQSWTLRCPTSMGLWLTSPSECYSFLCI